MDPVTMATVDTITRSGRIITGTTADITSRERTITEVIRIPTTGLSITTDPTGITITGTGIATIARIDSGKIRETPHTGSARHSLMCGLPATIPWIGGVHRHAFISNYPYTANSQPLAVDRTVSR
jgi:hypothetical protein